MKRNKRIIYLGSALVTTASVAIAVTLNTKVNKDVASKKTYLNVLADDKQTVDSNPASSSTGASVSVPRTNLQHADSVIQDPIKFSEVGKIHAHSAATNGWTPTYIPTDWEHETDIEISYFRAREDGWRSMSDYEKYLRAHYELTGGEVETTFGEYVTHPWIAWHHNSGGQLWGSYNDGDQSNVRPTWQGVENEKENNINNTIPWYLYDRGGKIFAFDNNNLQNAFKRLEYMKRIEKTSMSQIFFEEGKDKNGNKISRNKYLINGQFQEMNPMKTYYYVKDSEIDYVRDANGWKVLLCPEDIAGSSEQEKYENMFKLVLNPHPQGTTATKAGDVTVVAGANEKYRIATTDVAGYATETDPIQKQKILDNARQSNIILKEEFSETVYPSDYNVNADYALAGVNELSPAQNGKELHDASITWSGLYKLARKSANFTDMVNDPNTLMPQEWYTWNNSCDQYGRKSTRMFIGDVGSGGYNSIWVENGHGGQKVWKNIRTLTDGVDPKRPIGNNGHPGYLGKGFEDVVRHESSNGEVKFYANFQHVFPGTDQGRSWFQDLKDEWERVGN